MNNDAFIATLNPDGSVKQTHAVRVANAVAAVAAPAPATTIVLPSLDPMDIWMDDLTERLTRGERLRLAFGTALGSERMLRRGTPRDVSRRTAMTMLEEIRLQVRSNRSVYELTLTSATETASRVRQIAHALSRHGTVRLTFGEHHVQRMSNAAVDNEWMARGMLGELRTMCAQSSVNNQLLRYRPGLAVVDDVRRAAEEASRLYAEWRTTAPTTLNPF